MLKIYINFLLVTVIFFITGCGGGNSELDGLNQNEYKIVKERQEFEKNQNATMNFNVENSTPEMLTMLLDAHVKIMYRIEVTQATELSSVTISENTNINLHKILIPTKDYYYDSVNQALYLAVSIPYIYMLDNNLALDVKINANKGRKGSFTKTIRLNFQSQPMSDNGENFLSFTYKKSVQSDDVDPFILSMIETEVTNANITRFSKSYIDKYKDILGVN